MNTKELLEYHSELCNKGREIMAKKNHDYSGSSGETPFANFEASRVFGIDPRKGILLRILDKLMRVNTLIDSGTLLVEDENLENSCVDDINYLILIAAIFKELKDKQKTTNDNLPDCRIGKTINESYIHTPGFSPP